MSETYRLDLEKFQERLGKRFGVFCQAVTQTLFNEIQTGGKYSPGTPIDTGFARLSWQGGIGSGFEPTAPSMTPAEAKANPGAARAAARDQQRRNAAVARRVVPGDLVVLANSAPYILKLEYGSSTQAPTGMIRNALRNSDQIASEVIRHLQGEPDALANDTQD